MTAPGTNAETYYHFTTDEAWESIQREGLTPQPFKPYHPNLKGMCRDLGIGEQRGIYIWPEVDRKLLRDFFLFKQVHERGIDVGMLLAVEVNPAHMLGRQWLALQDRITGEKNKLDMWHDLNFNLADGTSRNDHRATMELYLSEIPPENIEVIAVIQQVIVPILDNSCLAIDLGLTD
jgi:hypothetical protein